MTMNHNFLSVIPRSVRWRIQLGIFQSVDPAEFRESSTKDILDAIYQINTGVIQQQKERFQSLMEKYVEEEVEDELHSPEPPQTAALPEVDPLTAIVMEQQAIETRKAELLLKYKKERARRKRGLTTEGRHIGDESDGIDRASVSTNLCTNTQWRIQNAHSNCFSKLF